MTVERDRTLKTSNISQHECIEDLLTKYDADKNMEFDNPCAYNFSEEFDFHELEALSNSAFYENQDRPEARWRVSHANTSFYFIKCAAILV